MASPNDDPRVERVARAMLTELNAAQGAFIFLEDEFPVIGVDGWVDLYALAKAALQAAGNIE